MGMVGISIPFLKYFNHKVKHEKEVNQNKIHIKILKKIIKEPDFKKFTLNFRKELNVTHLSLPTFIIQYDLLRLYNLKNIYESEKAQKKKKRDPNQRLFLDYTSYFTYIEKKLEIANKLLYHIDQEIRILNTTLKKSVGKQKTHELKLRKKELLERAQKFKRMRPNLLRELPKAGQMSSFAFDRTQRIRKAAAKSFPLLQ